MPFTLSNAPATLEVSSLITTSSVRAKFVGSWCKIEAVLGTVVSLRMKFSTLYTHLFTDKGIAVTTRKLII